MSAPVYPYRLLPYPIRIPNGLFAANNFFNRLADPEPRLNVILNSSTYFTPSADSRPIAISCSIQDFLYAIHFGVDSAKHHFKVHPKN